MINSSSRLIKSTWLLCFLGLALALTSFLFHKESKEIFSLLYFYIAFLWILWIICLLFGKSERPIRDLCLLWILIDVIALALFVSAALDIDNFAQARGTEMVVYITYLPMIIPTGYAHELLPLNIEKYFSSSVGSAFAVWLEFSIIAAVQASILFLIIRMFKNMRKTQVI